MTYRVHFHAVSVSAAEHHIEEGNHEGLPDGVRDSLLTLLHAETHDGPVEVCATDAGDGTHSISVQHIVMIGEPEMETTATEESEKQAA